MLITFNSKFIKFIIVSPAIIKDVAKIIPNFVNVLFFQILLNEFAYFEKIPLTIPNIAIIIPILVADISNLFNKITSYIKF